MESAQEPTPVFLDPTAITPPLPPEAQNNAPQQPATQQPNEIQKPKLRHKLSFLLPGIVVLGSLIGGILLTDWVLKNRQTQPEPTPTPQPTLQPATPAPTITPVVQIKSYRDRQQGFTFVYPDSFSAVECDNGVRFYTQLPEDVEIGETCSSISGGEIKVYYSRQPIVIGFGENATDELIAVAGYDAISTKSAGENGFVWHVSFERDRVYYAIELTDQQYSGDFTQLLESFKFIGDQTKDWIFYSNNSYRYQISYPPNWTMIASQEEKVGTGAKNVEFRKNELDSKEGSLVIEADTNVADANLTAREVISSTKSLQGWATSPSLELRQIGGGTAQVLQGVFNGRHQSFIVVWYKNRLVQMVWNDEVGQPNEEILEGFLITFRFN